MYIILEEQDITSMEAFRSAIINNNGLRKHYLDDLSEIYKNDDEEWHNAFMHYHDLRDDMPIMDQDMLAIGVSSNGFWIDDLKFVPVDNIPPIRLAP